MDNIVAPDLIRCKIKDEQQSSIGTIHIKYCINIYRIYDSFPLAYLHNKLD